jgi:hypothetical protein
MTDPLFFHLFNGRRETALPHPEERAAHLEGWAMKDEVVPFTGGLSIRFAPFLLCGFVDESRAWRHPLNRRLKR